MAIGHRSYDNRLGFVPCASTKGSRHSTADVGSGLFVRPTPQRKRWDDCSRYFDREAWKYSRQCLRRTDGWSSTSKPWWLIYSRDVQALNTYTPHHIQVQPVRRVLFFFPDAHDMMDMAMLHCSSGPAASSSHGRRMG